MKADFNETQIAESAKFTITPAESLPDFTFAFSLSVNPAEQSSMDDVANKPIVLTLIEVLPKEKKTQKEEKIQPYGQSVIDLLDLLKGHTDKSLRLPIYAMPGSSLEQQTPPTLQAQQQAQIASGDAAALAAASGVTTTSNAAAVAAAMLAPEVEVRINIEQPLLSEDELAKTNLVTVNFEAMYALPDAWTSPSSSGKDYAYSAALPMPASEEVRFLVCLSSLKRLWRLVFFWILIFLLD